MKRNQLPQWVAVALVTLVTANLAVAGESVPNAPYVNADISVIQGTDRGGAPSDGVEQRGTDRGGSPSNDVEQRGTDRGGIDALLRLVLGPRR